MRKKKDKITVLYPPFNSEVKSFLSQQHALFDDNKNISSRCVGLFILINNTVLNQQSKLMRKKKIRSRFSIRHLTVKLNHFCPNNMLYLMTIRIFQADVLVYLFL